MIMSPWIRGTPDATEAILLVTRNISIYGDDAGRHQRLATMSRSPSARGSMMERVGHRREVLVSLSLLSIAGTFFMPSVLLYTPAGRDGA